MGGDHGGFSHDRQAWVHLILTYHCLKKKKKHKACSLSVVLPKTHEGVKRKELGLSVRTKLCYYIYIRYIYIAVYIHICICRRGVVFVCVEEEEGGRLKKIKKKSNIKKKRKKRASDRRNFFFFFPESHHYWSSIYFNHICVHMIEPCEFFFELLLLHFYFLI